MHQLENDGYNNVWKFTDMATAKLFVEEIHPSKLELMRADYVISSMENESVGEEDRSEHCELMARLIGSREDGLMA